VPGTDRTRRGYASARSRSSAQELMQ
jgi:hypothetical protein